MTIAYKGIILYITLTQTPTGENNMDQKENDIITKAIGNLIINNMKAGYDYDTAKGQAFNRMNKEYPGLINVWIQANC